MLFWSKLGHSCTLFPISVYFPVAACGTVSIGSTPFWTNSIWTNPFWTYHNWTWTNTPFGPVEASQSVQMTVVQMVEVRLGLVQTGVNLFQEVVKSIRIPYPCFTANKFTVKRSDYCQNPGCCSFEFVTSGILLSVGANIIWKTEKYFPQNDKFPDESFEMAGDQLQSCCHWSVYFSSPPMRSL